MFTNKIVIFILIALQVHLNGAIEEDTMVNKPLGLKIYPRIGAQLDQKKTSKSYSVLEESTNIMNMTTPGNPYSYTCYMGCDETGGIYDPNRPCQCNFDCYAYGDCCADYSQYCATDVPAGYIMLNNYNDDKCMDYTESSTYVKNGECVPFEDMNGTYANNVKFVSYIGRPPVLNYYSPEDTECNGTILTNTTIAEGCSYGTRAASISKSYFEYIASQYTGFAYLSYSSKDKAKNSNYKKASYVTTFDSSCSSDRTYMGITYSKKPECIRTGNSYVETYFLGSGCSSSYTRSSKSKSLMKPEPIYGGFYLDLQCFVSKKKPDMKYNLKSSQTINNNEKKDMISEVKYKPRQFYTKV